MSSYDMDWTRAFQLRQMCANQMYAKIWIINTCLHVFTFQFYELQSTGEQFMSPHLNIWATWSFSSAHHNIHVMNQYNIKILIIYLNDNNKVLRQSFYFLTRKLYYNFLIITFQALKNINAFILHGYEYVVVTF